MKDLLPQYKSSRWINKSGETISSCFVYDDVFVEVTLENSLRGRAAVGVVKVAIYMDRSLLFDVNVEQAKYVVVLPPISSKSILVPFKPLHEAKYYYKVFIENNEVYTQLKNDPSRLCVSRRESRLIIERVVKVSKNPGYVVVGRLVDALTGEGIEKAKIKVYDVRTLRNDELLACEVTSKEGAFTVDGLRTYKIGGRLKIYVKFEGDDIYKPAASSYYVVD